MFQEGLLAYPQHDNAVAGNGDRVFRILRFNLLMQPQIAHLAHLALRADADVRSLHAHLRLIFCSIEKCDRYVATRQLARPDLLVA